MDSETALPTWQSIKDGRRQARAEAAMVTAMGHPGVPPRGGRAYLTCAAVANGCPSFLALPLSAPVSRLAAAEINRDHAALEFLRMNSWHVDHGRWVCSQHERKPCTCPPETAAALTGGVCSGEDWCAHCR